MYKTKLFIVFCLIPLLFTYSSPIQANDIDNIFEFEKIEEKLPKVEFTKTEKPENIEGTVKYSTRFFDNESALILIPPPKMNDRICIPAPEINDSIAIRTNEKEISNDRAKIKPPIPHNGTYIIPR